MVDKPNEQQKRIGECIMKVFNIEQFTVDSLTVALSQLSNMTLIAKRDELESPLSSFSNFNSNSNNSLLHFNNLMIVFILIPLFIFEHKYLVVSRKCIKCLMRNGNGSKSGTKIEEPKPTISISYIETNSQPSQFESYGEVSDISTFYNKAKTNLSKSHDSVLTCSPTPSINLLHSMSSDQSIKGKSFDEIYNTVIQMRNERKVLQYEGGKLSGNNIFYSSFKKKKSNQIN